MRKFIRITIDTLSMTETSLCSYYNNRNMVRHQKKLDHIRNRKIVFDVSKEDSPIRKSPVKTIDYSIKDVI